MTGAEDVYFRAIHLDGTVGTKSEHDDGVLPRSCSELACCSASASPQPSLRSSPEGPVEMGA